jgi:signal transduction histidine kinase
MDYRSQKIFIATHSLRLVLIGALVYLLVYPQAYGREVCAQRIDASYTFKDLNKICPDDLDCWIGILPPEDTLKVVIDEQPVIDLRASNHYVRFDSFYHQLTAGPNNIQVFSQDLNESHRFLSELCLNLGTYPQVKLQTSVKWFFRTGATLFSAYFLLIASVFIACSLAIARSRTGLALLNYSVVSVAYLLSFSEIPRLFGDPVILSGGVHFPLRLFQDFSLVFVLYHFYKAENYARLFRVLNYLYALVIGAMLMMVFAGVNNYIFFERIMIFFSPLIAMPLAVGLLFAVLHKDSFERRILIPFYTLLFIFQINDLLNFWGVAITYFTVKLYIPIIICLILFLHFRRIYNSFLSEGILNERQKLLNRFVHDMKSPLSAIKVVVLDGLKEAPERMTLVKSAIERIESMANELLFDGPSESELSAVPLVSLLESVISEKKAAHSGVIINFDHSHEVFVYSNDIILSRVISNIINNAAESYENSREPVISIFLTENESSIKLAIKDLGRGMSAEVVERAKSGGFTTKNTGKGLGLSSSMEVLTSLGGSLDIYSMPGKGTTVELLIPRADIPFWYHTDRTHNENIIKVPSNVFLNNYFSEMKPMKGFIYVGKYHYDRKLFHFLESNSISIIRESEFESVSENSSEAEYVLIDDDKYVCKAWELSMRDKGKKFLALQSYQEFLSNQDALSRSVKIFLDRHLADGTDLLTKIDEITALGFRDLTMISSDVPQDFKGKSFLKINPSKLPPL